MAKGAVQWIRDSDGDWKPVGVWLATPAALMSRFDPAAGMDGFLKRIHDYARPSTDFGGNWEGWLTQYAPDALSNGHDLQFSLVDPELTVDELYAREVLGLDADQRKGFTLQGIPNLTAIELPELSGPAGSA